MSHNTLKDYAGHKAKNPGEREPEYPEAAGAWDEFYMEDSAIRTYTAPTGTTLSQAASAAAAHGVVMQAVGVPVSVLTLRVEKDADGAKTWLGFAEPEGPVHHHLRLDAQGAQAYGAILVAGEEGGRLLSCDPVAEGGGGLSARALARHMLTLDEKAPSDDAGRFLLVEAHYRAMSALAVTALRENRAIHADLTQRLERVRRTFYGSPLQSRLGKVQRVQPQTAFHVLLYGLTSIVKEHPDPRAVALECLDAKSAQQSPNQ